MKFKTFTHVRLHHHLLVLLTLLTSTSLMATEDELFFEMPIVLSANRLEQPVSDAAVSMSVIDRETIEASGARTIPEVLRLVPGMMVGYSGNEFGDEPKYVVTYHGHSDQYSKQMQVLIDGRSIYEPLLGGIQWKTIPINIDDIERIEVSRGPNLATYGSNTFMAAINIITRTAAEDQGSYVRANVGNHDIADLTYRYGGNSGNLDYRVTASTLNDDGLDSGNSIDYADDTHSDNIDYRLDYQINNHNTLSYQGGYGQNTQEADRNHDGLLPNARTVDNTRFFQFIKLESAINAENTLQLQYYYNLSDKDDLQVSDPVSIPPLDTFNVVAEDKVKSERHNLELTHSIYPDDDLKLVWGVSAQNDQVQAPLQLGVDEKVTHQKYHLFGNVEWYLNRKNIINFGALMEKNDFSDSEISPRASYTYVFNKQHRVRFGISKAIRSPFIYEEKANLAYSYEPTAGGVPLPDGNPYQTLREQVLLGNTALMNEQIISREIAYYGEFLNSSLLFNARLFLDDITNYIDTLREDVDPAIDNVTDDLTPGGPNTVLVFYNPIDTTTHGLEIEMDYRIDPSTRLIASGAIIQINSASDAMERSAPQNSLSLFATRRFDDKYNGSLGYYYVDKFKWTDVRGGHDSYSTLDLRLSRNYRFDKARGSLSLVLKNLLGDYSDYQQQPSNASAPQVIQNETAYIDFRLKF